MKEKSLSTLDIVHILFVFFLEQGPIPVLCFFLAHRKHPVFVRREGLRKNSWPYEVYQVGAATIN